MIDAHWFVPPPRALLGLRGAPGVPSAGHTLDPRACPACGTDASPKPTPVVLAPPARVAPVHAPPVVVLAPKPVLRDASTLVERVLRAALDLSEHGAIDAHALAVRAWQLYPESFALNGYPQYPNANAVLAKLSGDTGLIKRGLLRRSGRSTYKLTQRGRDLARTLRAPREVVA